MAYVPNSGSVAAYIQGNASVITKWQDSSVIGVVTGSVVTINQSSSILSVPVGSTISYVQNSVATVIIGGSVAVATGNSSVQVLNFPTTQNVSGSVAAFVVGSSSQISYIQNSVAAVIIGGSVTVATGNSSVQLLRGTETVGSIAAYLQSSAASVIGVNQSSSILAVPVGSTISYIQNSVATVIIGGSVAVATGNSSVQLLGSSAVVGSVVLSGGVNAIGSVAVLQGTNPWAETIVGSVITINQGSSILAGQTGTRITSVAGILENTIQASTTGIPVFFKSNISTSVLSVVSPSTPLPIQGSVSGTVNLGIGTAQIGSVVLSGGINAIGSVATLQGTNPWVVSGSVTLLGGVLPIGSVGTLQGTNPWVVAHPGGSVTAVRTDNASVILGTGTLQIGSVVLSGGVNAIGSVAALQGTNPWQTAVGGSIIAVLQGSSIISINAGSVFTVSLGSIITIQQANSIVGTYAEDAASASADKGVFTLGVRNDTVASVTSADGDYGATSVDAVGRMITKPFAGENATIISYTGSIVSGSVQLIQASVIGQKSYITDFWLSNTGATTTLVTIQDGSTSVLGKFIAPTGGGMSSPGLAIPLKTSNSQDLAFTVAPSTSVLYLTIKGWQGQ